MDTELRPADPDSLRRAAELLRGGELVAFPTETVYGLGARADSPQAVARIYRVKGRPESKPLILHLRSADQAPALATAWPDAAERLARRFWPGPLTMVLPRHPSVLDAVTACGPTVAMRVPAHPVALALLDACGLVLAAPSANPFGALPPRTARDVVQGLGGRVPLVLDGGTVGAPLPDGADAEPAQLASTIVDLTRVPAVILRQGRLARAEIAALVELAP